MGSAEEPKFRVDLYRSNSSIRDEALTPGQRESRRSHGKCGGTEIQSGSLQKYFINSRRILNPRANENQEEAMEVRRKRNRSSEWIFTDLKTYQNGGRATGYL
ncbi:uncharacterized protein [Bemisia tabaci]|uniref:uncharacterized protein n=1 Tax=Bemisia tabaci TaxID=7038 RepID=UPI003B28D9C7